MAKQNLFPVLLDGEVTITADKTWGKTGTGETGVVGMVKLNGGSANASDLTFDSDDIPAGLESGMLIYVINISGYAHQIEITPDPASAAAADTMSIGIGDIITVMYHHDHGFLFFSNVQAT
jgi:hypothetical protein